MSSENAVCFLGLGLAALPGLAVMVLNVVNASALVTVAVGAVSALACACALATLFPSLGECQTSLALGKYEHG